MSSITLRHAILAVLTPTIATAAFADDSVNLPVVDLGQEVITVARIATPLTQTPASVGVISNHEINTNPARNLSDAIQSDAGVSVKQSGGIGQIAEVSIRGNAPIHTLVLKDGARLNGQNHLGAVYPALIDLTGANHIEIAKGPASVQYGSDAIGGVVQIVSAKPTKTGISVTGIAGEHDTYKAIVQGDIAQGGFYASLGGQRLETDGTRIFDNRGRNNTASFDQKGYNAKIGYHNETVDTSVSYSQNEGVNNFNAGGPLNNSPREFDNRVLNAKAALKVAPAATVSARYSNAQDKQNVPGYGSFYNTENNEGDLNTRWAFAPNQNILFGATYLESEYESNTVADGLKKTNSIGYYLQHQLNTEQLNTQVGVRLEDNKEFGNHVVGQGAVRYHISPSTSIHANIGSAFRAPALSELYYNDRYTKGNPDLKPEESLSYEAGITHRYNDQLQVSLTGYRTEIKNLVAYSSDPVTWIGTYENLDKVTSTGGELGMKYSQDNYYAQAQYAYNDTVNKATDNNVAYRPKHTGTLTLGYDDGVVGVSTSAVARSGAYANNTNTVKVPGFVTVDVNTHWQVNPRVKLFTNIQNIANSEHKTVQGFSNNWYVNGGRQANIGATFSY